MNKQHVLALHVAEVLRDRQRRQCDPQPHTRWLVHLTEHERRLREHRRLAVAHHGLAHLDEEVGALAGALADAGEHGHAAVLRGDAVDHLGDQHRLADPGATEQADLAALEVGGEQVDDLDACLEHEPLGLERVERRSFAVDLPGVFDAVERVDVERQTEHVEHVAEHPVANGHDETVSQVLDGRSSTEAVRRLQTDGAHAPLADLLRDLRGDVDLLAAELDGELQCVVDLGQRAPRELDVDDRAGNGDDFAVLQRGLGFGSGFGNGHVNSSR